jgi:hypothetical protein
LTESALSASRTKGRAEPAFMKSSSMTARFPAAADAWSPSTHRFWLCALRLSRTIRTCKLHPVCQCSQRGRVQQRRGAKAWADEHLGLEGLDQLPHQAAGHFGIAALRQHAPEIEDQLIAEVNRLVDDLVAQQVPLGGSPYA